MSITITMKEHGGGSMVLRMKEERISNFASSYDLINNIFRNRDEDYSYRKAD